MRFTTVAIYKRESTLWANANGFYRAQDWVTMYCRVYDYTEEINATDPEKVICPIRFIDSKGNDVTDSQIKKLYGRPYVVEFENKNRNNRKSYEFATKEEANAFVKDVLANKRTKNFKIVQ